MTYTEAAADCAAGLDSVSGSLALAACLLLVFAAVLLLGQYRIRARLSELRDTARAQALHIDALTRAIEAQRDSDVAALRASLDRHMRTIDSLLGASDAQP